LSDMSMVCSADKEAPMPAKFSANQCGGMEPLIDRFDKSSETTRGTCENSMVSDYVQTYMFAYARQ